MIDVQLKVHSIESFGTVDGPGIRVVIFLQGCPLRCLYCHNIDSVNFDGGKFYSVQDLVSEVLKYKAYISKNGGVTVSGGEPLFQIDGVIELFKILKSHGIHTAVDTSGIMFDNQNSAMVSKHDKLLEYTDLFILDIKHIDSEKAKVLTGKSNSNNLAFANYLSNNNKSMWIRQVLLTNYTDNIDDLKTTRKFIESLNGVEKIEVLPFHNLGESKYTKLGIPYRLKGVSPPNEHDLHQAKDILIKGKL